MEDAPGTLRMRALGSLVQRSPHEGRTVVFGRNEDEVHLEVGGDDPRVSRRHGALTYGDGRWLLSNLGRLPIRVADRLLFPGEEPVPLPLGYTPLVVHGSPGREHLVEVYIADGSGHRQWADDVTRGPATWPLSPDERIALIVLGQRYLHQEPHPQPLTWQATAAQLAELQPDRRWRQGRVEHLVLAVRQRLSAGGVAGLTREEVGEPVGNTLNHNLLVELLRSTTLRPADADVLDR